MGNPKIEFPGNEINDSDQFSGGSVSTGFGLGGLYQAIYSFKHAIVDLGFKPPKDAGPMALDGSGCIASGMLQLCASTGRRRPGTSA